MDAFSEQYLKEIRGSADSALAGRRVVLGITGSVAAIECPRLSRLLMRHGADVHVCMTSAATTLVTPTSMAWCTGNPVITELTGRVEHLYLAGEWEGRADLLLVAPATANTVAKMALGIDDTVVTTVATTALGAGVPVVVAPGMHACLAGHPAFPEHLQRLRGFGVTLVQPDYQEGKAKMASVEDIVAAVVARLGRRDLAGRRVLLTAGPTVEYLDPVRVVTNLSSGRMGVALAEAARDRGAAVTFVYGPGTVPPPSGVQVVRVVTTAEMLAAVRSVLEREPIDVTVLAAAVCDYTPAERRPEKCPTADAAPWNVALVPTPKIVASARGWTTGLLVSFKAETTDSDDALRQAARVHLAHSGADLTVANRVGPGRGFVEATNEVFVLGSDGGEAHVPMAAKRTVAESIWDEVARRL